MNERDEAGGIAFETLVGMLRRRLALIVIAIAVAVGAALVFSLLKEKEYTSSASVVVQSAGSDPLASPLGSSEPTPEQRAADTNLVLAARDVIARRTATRLDKGGESAAAGAVGSVALSAKGDSELIKVKATAKEPATAARAANAFADELVAFGRDSTRANISRTQRLLRRELKKLSARRRSAAKAHGGARKSQEIRSLSRRIRSLESRSADLSTLASLQTGDAAVIERATPSASASSPKPIKNMTIGAFAGLLLGLGLALAREQQDRRLRDSKELEDAFGLPVLARVPESKVLGGRSSMLRDLPPLEAEGFRMLRANLRHIDSNREIDSVLVTSPAVEDGKSTVAFQLASAAAATGARVLLIEADIRRPVLARLLGLPEDEGLSQVLADDGTSLAEVTREVLLPHSTNGRASPPTLDVLPAGKLVPDASELIESERMQQVVREARRGYSLVVIDTPPAGLVSDAIPLMSQVSAVVVVGRLGKLTRADASRLRDQLEKINAPTVGIVANFANAHEGGQYPGTRG